MPNKLAIGGGIAAGADAFVKSFMAARGMEFQKKQQQNQVAIQALLSQLQDENTPLNKHGQIVDEIQRLANGGKPVKEDERLSLHLGLTPDSPLMQQDVATGETAKQTYNPNPQNQNPDSSITNPTNVGQLNQMAGNAPEMAIKDVNVTKKRGELTPFDMKQIQNRFNQKDEETRQTHLAQVQADIQEKSYKALGFQRIDDGKDVDGNRYTILQNPAGEIKVINLNTGKQTSTLPKDYTSTRELISQNRASTLPASVKVYEEDFLNKTNPETGTNYTPTEAHIAAVAKYADYVESQGTARTLGNIQTGQNVGTLPPSPKMQSEEDKQKESEVNGILDKWRNAYADYTEVSTNLSALQQQKDAAFEAKDEAQKEWNTFHAQEYDPSDKDQVAEGQRVNKNLEQKRKEANELQSKFDSLVAKGTRAKGEMTAISKQAKASKYQNEFNINQQGDVYLLDRNNFGGVDNKQNENEDPKVRSYADTYFNGDYQKALDFINKDSRNKKR